MDLNTYPNVKYMKYPENLSEKEILLLILKALQDIDERLLDSKIGKTIEEKLKD